LANVTLSGLLIRGRPGDDIWLAVGASMIAVDTLVHNVLARADVLAAFRGEHR
jgi:heme exporter protein D